MILAVDTSGYSAFKRGDGAAARLIETADEVVMPTVVLGELYAGFHLGSRTAENIDELVDFLGRPGVTLADVDQSVAERYGQLIRSLRKQGTPLPTNDVWIAAVALDWGARLLTFGAHFDHVPGIMVLPPPP